MDISLSVPSKREWASYRLKIEDMYLNEDPSKRKTNAEICEYFRHNYHKSIIPRQLEYRLKNWGIQKNSSAEQYARAHRECLKRGLAVDEATFMVNGMNKSPKKIKKTISRLRLDFPSHLQVNRPALSSIDAINNNYPSNGTVKSISRSQLQVSKYSNGELRSMLFDIPSARLTRTIVNILKRFSTPPSHSLSMIDESWVGDFIQDHEVPDLSISSDIARRLRHTPAQPFIGQALDFISEESPFSRKPSALPLEKLSLSLSVINAGDSLPQFIQKTIFLINNHLLTESQWQSLRNSFDSQALLVLLKTILDLNSEESKVLAESLIMIAARQADYEIIQLIIKSQVLENSWIFGQILHHGRVEVLNWAFDANLADYREIIVYLCSRAFRISFVPTKIRLIIAFYGGIDHIPESFFRGISALWLARRMIEDNDHELADNLLNRYFRDFNVFPGCLEATIETRKEWAVEACLQQGVLPSWADLELSLAIFPEVFTILFNAAVDLDLDSDCTCFNGAIFLITDRRTKLFFNAIIHEDNAEKAISVLLENNIAIGFPMDFLLFAASNKTQATALPLALRVTDFISRSISATDFGGISELIIETLKYNRQKESFRDREADYRVWGGSNTEPLASLLASIPKTHHWQILKDTFKQITDSEAIDHLNPDYTLYLLSIALQLGYDISQSLSIPLTNAILEGFVFGPPAQRKISLELLAWVTATETNLSNLSSDLEVRNALKLCIDRSAGKIMTFFMLRYYCFKLDGPWLDEVHETELEIASFRYTCHRYDQKWVYDPYPNGILYLLELGMDINIRCRSDGFCLLHFAILNRVPTLVEKILKENSKQIDYYCPEYGTALDLAVDYRKSRLVPILLDHGANPDGKAGILRHLSLTDPLKKHCRSPIMKAAEYGDLQSVMLLIQAGCDVNLRLYPLNGMRPGTALGFAAREGRSDIVSCLLKTNVDAESMQDAMKWATEKRHISIVKQINAAYSLIVVNR